MVRITVTDKLQAELIAASERVEIIGTRGELIGYFEPCKEKTELERAIAACPYTEEQMAEMMQQPGKYTTAEVLEKLKSL